MFQSRNRETFLFKSKTPETSRIMEALTEFQSRNRETFLFKEKLMGYKGYSPTEGFNLVIEKLFFSSEVKMAGTVAEIRVSIS